MQPVHVSGPAVISGVGTPVQHTYFQLLHQAAVPVFHEIVAVAHPWHKHLREHLALLANALGAYATVYALTTGNFNVLPIRIAAMVSGDISLDPNMASALAVILVGLMTLVTLVHQWLLKRSYHVAR